MQQKVNIYQLIGLLINVEDKKEGKENRKFFEASANCGVKQTLILNAKTLIPN